MWADVLLFAAAIALASFVSVVIANLVMVQRHIEYEVSQVPDLDSPEFLRLLAGMVGLKLSEGNHLRLLIDGKSAFPAMFDAVRRADHSVTFENYVYWSGEVGRSFAQLLADKAAEGVLVHVVLDWVGSLSMDRDSLQTMEQAGVEVHHYHRPRFGGMHRLNHRTHRRELVVDGRIAFTGGIGFGDNWYCDSDEAESWRDNHYEIHGPIVGGVQAAFLDNWLKTSGNLLIGNRYFPQLDARGESPASVLTSSPTERTTNGRLLLLMLLAAAKKSIRIEQAYFVPDRHLRDALAQAAQRGVAVEVLLPGEKIDFAIVRRASRATWGPMLEAGVRIFEYQPSMLHVKSMVIDGLWVVAGSANFDFRSLYRNDEIYLVVRDTGFAQQHVECFETDKQVADQVTLHNWRTRPYGDKLLDRLASLLRTQL